MTQSAKFRVQSSKLGNTTDPSGHASSMAELMARSQKIFLTIHKGDLVKGRITKLTSSEILVDIDTKTEAVVLEKDKRILRNLLSSLKVGDEVEASILNVESDTGNPVVSLRRFLDNLTWRRLAELQTKQEPLEVMVNEVTRGGFLVATLDGTSGFLPNSHTLFIHSKLDADGAQSFNDISLLNSQDLLNKKIKVYVLELNKTARKIIFSQKPVLNLQEFEEKIKDLKIGQKIEAIVANITSFGIFVYIPLSANGETQSAGFIDGLIHISEVAWNDAGNMQDSFQPGQKVEAIVIKFDKEAKRVDLSVKRLTVDPFAENTKNISVDQKITGVVCRIASNSVILEIEGISTEGKVEGIIRKEKIPPNTTYEVGDKITATVSQVDLARHRIMLVPVLKEKPLGYK